MDGDAGQHDQGNQPALSAGQQLATRRESLGWTVEQVASHLNLAPRQIVALETDNFSALPGMAISRGFVRAYAKLLKIDSTPLLALISKDAGTTSEPLPLRHALSASFSESRLPPMGKPGPSSKNMTIVLAVILLVGGAVLAFEYGAIPDVVSTAGAKLKAWTSSTATATAPDTTATDKSAIPVADGGTATGETQGAVAGSNATGLAASPNARTTGDNSAAGGTISVPAAAVTAPNAPSVALSSPPAATPVAPGADQQAPVAAGNNALVLKLNQDSWVDIRGPNNKVLISRIIKSGSTETFQIVEPVTLTIGNAAAVDVIFRGKTMDFKSITKTNVVKTTLK